MFLLPTLLHSSKSVQERGHQPSGAHGPTTSSGSCQTSPPPLPLQGEYRNIGTALDLPLDLFFCHSTRDSIANCPPQKFLILIPNSQMSDNNSATLKSYVDSAVGAGQAAMGSLTGNTENQVSSTQSIMAPCSQPWSLHLHLPDAL